MDALALACLLAADAVCSLKSRWIKTAVLLLVFMDCGLRSWVYLRNFQIDAGPRSTREQAADWIEANIPAGASVGLPRYPQPAHTPPFRYDRYHLVVFEKPEMLKSGDYPDFLVTDAANQSGLGKLLEPVYMTYTGPVFSAPKLPPYRLVREFRSYRLGWGEIQAEDFINSSFYIYQKVVREESKKKVGRGTTVFLKAKTVPRK